MLPTAAILALVSMVATLPAVTVRFRVIVPAETPRDATVWVSGDLAALGGWKADGLRLVRDGAIWSGAAELPEGPFEFKVTLGSWERCEVAKDGADRANRTGLAVAGATIDVTVEGWRSGAATPAPAPTATGSIRSEGPIGAVGGAIASRSVRVRVPKGYDDPKNAERRFPVLYMLDGQNVFDASTSFAGVEWRADETVDDLATAGTIEPSIVVAIPNSPARVDELTFVPAKGEGPLRAGGGQGEAMLRWIVEEVKPAVDAAYRTKPGRESTAIAGSSLGGLFTLEAVSRRGDVFGRGIAMSPSLWWAEEELLKRWTERPAERPKNVRLWIDTGTDEGRGDPATHVARARRLGELLKEDPGVTLLIEEGGKHHESAWAKRLPAAMTWALGIRRSGGG